MTVFKIFVAVSLAGTFAGCKSSKGDVVSKLDGFQKAMCECKDKACADKVSADMTSWGTEMAKSAGKDEKPDPALAKKSADLMAKYTECMTKAMTGGGGGAATEPKPAAAAACSPDHTKNEAGRFCVKLLPSFKALPEKKSGATTTYTYRDDNNNVSIEVKPYNENEYDVDLRSMNSSAESRKGTSSELPNKGKFWLYTDADSDVIGVSTTRNDAAIIACYTKIGTGSIDKDKDALLAICKSVLPL